jgi:hypothetical protein
MPGVEIQECYRDFTPPAWVRKTVNRIIYRTAPHYLAGLGAVVLTNSGVLNHAERRQKTISRKRKVPIRECRGLYYQKWQGQPAIIQLFVDNIVSSWPAPVIKWRLFRDILLVEVFYHELGHHIHKTSAPEYKEREDVADHWAKKLSRLYLRRQYWYLTPFIAAVSKVLQSAQKLKRLAQRKIRANKGFQRIAGRSR